MPEPSGPCSAEEWTGQFGHARTNFAFADEHAVQIVPPGDGRPCLLDDVHHWLGLTFLTRFISRSKSYPVEKGSERLVSAAAVMGSGREWSKQGLLNHDGIEGDWFDAVGGFVTGAIDQFADGVAGHGFGGEGFEDFGQLGGPGLRINPLGQSGVRKDEGLYQRFPKLQEVERSTLVAVGVEYQGRDYVLSDGDEVSLFPPVQGG